MTPSVDERIRLAGTAHGGELWTLVRDSHPEVVVNVTLSRNLSEEMAVFLASKRSTPSEALGFLAGDVRFTDSYRLKRALCRNAKTPQRITLSLLSHLRIFDLGDVTRHTSVPAIIRLKAEHILMEKMPSLPTGIRIALAKRASSALIISIMARGDKKVVGVCLDSPAITEGQLCALIQKQDTKPHIIQLVSEHPKWSLRYAIRLLLIMNCHTPMEVIPAFIAGMKTSDLRELYGRKDIPSSTMVFIFRQLAGRGDAVEIPREEIFELSGSEQPDPDDIDTA
jgi:hypothetical protein